MSTENFEPKQELSLEQVLQAVPYHSMRKKFAELGIESTWTSGTSKVDLVASAIEKLADIKQAIGEGVDKEDLDQAVIEKQQARKVELEKAEDEKAEALLAEQNSTKSRIELKYTLEDGTLDLPTLQKVEHHLGLVIQSCTSDIKKLKANRERRDEVQRLIAIALNK
tara:strand:+ start:292 stop:792 length:501 start_codon:yes stop_codon:yes gene_type:complete